MSFTTQLKNLSLNGKLSLEKAIPFAEVKDQHEATSLELLEKCIAWVGMDLESSIRTHIANINGTKFNETEFFYEKPVGEQ